VNPNPLNFAASSARVFALLVCNPSAPSSFSTVPPLRYLPLYFEFYMDVFYPNQRSDLDNSLKVVLDCLQKVKAIQNDNKCVKIVVRKFLDKEKPRVEFVIKEIDTF
jgi:Holliday junction resolvase RusA-like endonuclease